MHEHMKHKKKSYLLENDSHYYSEYTTFLT